MRVARSAFSSTYGNVFDVVAWPRRLCRNVLVNLNSGKRPLAKLSDFG